MDLASHIRTIPDFPKPGVLFYDIATLIAHPEALRETVCRLVDAIAPLRCDLVAGIEARGFILSAPVALLLGAGLVMIRKQGKLPGATRSKAYALEYGTSELEIQVDAITPGKRVVLIDDLMATGGTMAASIALVSEFGADVQATFSIIELDGLGGRERIGVPFKSLVRCPA